MGTSVPLNVSAIVNTMCEPLLPCSSTTNSALQVSIRTDTNNEKYALWFYFQVMLRRMLDCCAVDRAGGWQVDNVAGCSGGRAGQIVFFNITNFSKTRSLYRDGMSPAVRSTSRPQWTRVPSKCCFYYKSNRQKRYCLTFAFAFDKVQCSSLPQRT